MSSDRRLFVLRHADAVSHGSGLSDQYRPLSARGQQALPELRRRLEDRAAPIRVVRCSAAVRAAATLEGLRAALPDDVDIEVSNDLYQAGGDALLERCRELDDDVPGALFIGHNPGVAALVHAADDPGHAGGPTDAVGWLPTRGPGGAGRPRGLAGARLGDLPADRVAPPRPAPLT
jgi:phosphohistidine phosphatase